MPEGDWHCPLCKCANCGHPNFGSRLDVVGACTCTCVVICPAPKLELPTLDVVWAGSAQVIKIKVYQRRPDGVALDGCWDGNYSWFDLIMFKPRCSVLHAARWLVWLRLYNKGCCVPSVFRTLLIRNPLLKLDAEALWAPLPRKLPLGLFFVGWHLLSSSIHARVYLGFRPQWIDGRQFLDYPCQPVEH